MKTLKAILIAMAFFWLAACSDSPPGVDLNGRLTAIDNSGLVNVCSSSTQAQEFAFSVNTQSMMMRWWSAAGESIQSGESEIYQINEGRSGLNGVSVEPHLTYTPISYFDGPLLRKGVLSEYYDLSIRNTPTITIVGNWNPSYGNFDYFYCSQENYSAAVIDGLYLN